MANKKKRGKFETITLARKRKERRTRERNKGVWEGVAKRGALVKVRSPKGLIACFSASRYFDGADKYVYIGRERQRVC